MRSSANYFKCQFPAWASLEFTHVDGGWSNEMYRLGRDLAVRIPRRLIRTAHECPTNACRYAAG